MDAPYWGRAPGTPSSIYHYFMTHPPSPTLDYSISHSLFTKLLSPTLREKIKTST